MRGGGGQYQEIAGVAQLVERKPSKLDVAGSSPVSRSAGVARIAQSVEHILGKDEVTGSIPVACFGRGGGIGAGSGAPAFAVKRG